MPTKKKYLIGTRGSLLATTQAGHVQQELIKKIGDDFELVTIKTTGDIKTSKPLWQYDGKDFFTKELDEALINKKVDLVVHSLKDLSTERPKEFSLAAVFQRKFGGDILLVRQELLNHQTSGDKFILGTSSPRRMEQAKLYLQKLLPTPLSKLPLEIKSLRGNVDTRITKLKNKEYDGIILAYAGLERLALNKDITFMLQKLLEGLNFMLLPESKFPGAAGQGALGIECLSDNHDLCEKLKKIDDLTTRQEVEQEKKFFKTLGGTCHLPVGIRVKKWKDKEFHFMSGKWEDKTLEHKEQVEPPTSNSSSTWQSNDVLFIGLPQNKLDKRFDRTKFPFKILTDDTILKNVFPSIQVPSEGRFFITSNYCAQAMDHLSFKGTTWVSGEHTWEDLAKKGHWVHGSTGPLGYKSLEEYNDSHFFHLMEDIQFSQKLPWVVFSHQKATSTLGKVVSCYEHKVHTPWPDIEVMKKVKACYWMSFIQYELYTEHFPFLKEENVKNYCGLGKTWERFQKENIPVSAVINYQHLLNMITKTPVPLPWELST